MPYTILSEFYNHKISFNHKKFTDITVDRVEPQTHDGFEIIYVKEGNLTYRIADKSFFVKKDNMILTRPGNIHLIDFNDKAVYDRYDIIFDVNVIFNDIYKKLSEDIHVMDCAKSPMISELFEKMDYYCAHYTDSALENILLHLADEIFYHIVPKKASSASVKVTEHPELFQILSYIEEHLNEQLTLEMICNRLYISKGTLHRIFLEHLNISPKKYIRAKRLLMAQKMLRKGKSATNIYEQCGFTDYSSFYRSYKKEFGHPPSDEKSHSYIRPIVY